MFLKSFIYFNFTALKTSYIVVILIPCVNYTNFLIITNSTQITVNYSKIMQEKFRNNYRDA